MPDALTLPPQQALVAGEWVNTTTTLQVEAPASGRPVKHSLLPLVTRKLGEDTSNESRCTQRLPLDETI